jgi:hypothetical protein
MSTQGRLSRSFPGRAVSIPANTFFDKSFQHELSDRLSRLSQESVSYYEPSSKKAGTNVREERDTTDPGLVLDHLMTMLSALGTNEHVLSIQKSIRDDVVWNDALLPWRRSPFWLLLKVSILRTLLALETPAEAHMKYKQFMIKVMAYLLDLALHSDIAPDLLSVVHVKLARRLVKHKQIYQSIVPQHILDTSEKARKVIDGVWSLECAKSDVVKKIPTTDWEKATNLKLPQARAALCEAVKRIELSAIPQPFVAPTQPRISTAKLPSLQNINGGDNARIIVLAEVEAWVEKHLETWTETAMKNPATDSFDNLVALIVDYWSLTTVEYDCSPLKKSMALLILLELWVTLDKLCVLRIPLMSEYSPELSVSLLEPLLLPKMDQMRRLSRVEGYISKRSFGAAFGATSVFDEPKATSLPIRFFDTSSKLWELRSKITEQDDQNREAKLKEFKMLSEEHDELTEKARSIHSSIRFDIYHNKKSCSGCYLNRKCKRMRIYVHEKSLPEDNVQSKAAVFELAVPLEFAAWRDATWFIIHDVGQRSSGCNAGQVYESPVSYDQLRPFVQARTRQPRVTLASCTKTFIRSHYQTVTFPMTISEVCVPNALRYDMLDRNGKAWLASARGTPNFKILCTLSLPLGPYKNLEWAVQSSRHTTNEVMATQSECSESLEIREYVAFGSLRSGERLQWLNILREYGCSNLTFNDPAVTTLILQAAWEAGSSSQHDHRIAHDELRNPMFCTRLLAVLDEKLSSIKPNWQEQNSMMSIIQLVLRVLSLTSDEAVKAICLRRLVSARNVCIAWCRQIKSHLSSNSTRGGVQEKATVQLLSAALSCYSTFDVDEQFLDRVLASSKDVAILIEAQITVSDSTPGSPDKLPMLLRQSLLHHTFIAHKLEPHVRSRIEDHGTGINRAVQRTWHSATLHSVWQPVATNGSSWLTNRTVSRGKRSQVVHFNLLGGDLLVDGKPIGKLPKDTMSQLLFKQLFGSAVPNVFASDMAGMDYAIAHQIQRNEIHIGMRSGQLLIRARFEDRMLQALPQTIFLNQLPSYFVHSFAHWLDESTGEVEFRPIESPWSSDRDNWRLTFSDLNFLQAKSQMRSKQKRLLENESPVGKSVAKILEGLDSAHHLEVVLDDFRSTELTVYLRRYNLYFHVTEDGQLLCLEYGSTVDTDLSIGTLIGLRSKLVLRDTSPVTGLQERRVIIPWGNLVKVKTSEHITISIPHGTQPKQKYFVYTLDRHLRKLRGQQDVLGILYKAYLHAVTSFLLPDPLTGRTGTEESLATLKEASLFSCVPLDNNQIDTLNLIASLTPKRTYYPQHKRSMQIVKWDSTLSPLVQHDDFFLAATAVFEHHSKTDTLLASDQGSSVKYASRGDGFLLRRARLRNASVAKSGLYSELIPSQDDDADYAGRDIFSANDRAKRVFEIASLIKEWPSQIATHKSLTEVLQAWDDVSGYDSGAFVLSSLQQLSMLDFKKHFGSLYELCRHASRDSATYPLMFKFCMLAIGADGDKLMHMKTLLAVAFSGSFKEINPPRSIVQYSLSKGSSPSRESLMEIINQGLIEHELCHDPNEDQIAEFDKLEFEQNEQKELLCTRIFSMWPAVSIIVRDEDNQHMNMASIVRRCQALFDEWHKNRLYLEHIKSVDERLKSIQAPQIIFNLPTAPSPRISPVFRAYVNSSLPKLLTWRASELLARGIEPVSNLSLRPKSSLEDTSEVKKLLSVLSAKLDVTHGAYSNTLRASIEALESNSFDLDSQDIYLQGDIFDTRRASLTEQVETTLEYIQEALRPVANTQKILEHADLWPRLSVPCLLAQLTPRNLTKLPKHWKTLLLNLGEKIASLQRAERISTFYHASKLQNLWNELKHPGREGWKADEYPSWLLLEIESNITIRPLQAKVAKEMISPSSGCNSVLQLNMGEGKSSVIVPMLAAALADGKRLVRVVVLKPLLPQTLHVLTKSSSGFLDQPIGHIPFSRKTKITHPAISNIQETLQHYAKNYGVMIALPEEILSMRLMTRERMTSNNSLSTAVLDMHRWLEYHARDVLDESDEILSVRSQLIYPVGGQQMLDGKSDRWQIAQAVLQRVHVHVGDLAASNPSELELEYSGKSFPLLKFLHHGAGERLLQLLVEDAIDGRITGISLDFCSADTRVAVKRYLSSREVSKQDDSLVTAALREAPQWNALLILRGLFAYDVLQFALQEKRWLVEYGLDPRRCLMAVPYRAKGIPSTNSEFGHPDVAILLTCLSYYYTGLTIEQMYSCFTILSKDSNPQDVYNDWTSSNEFPLHLKSYEAVNLDDKALCEDVLYPRMQFNLGIITFYLNQVVFPKEGKEFKKRISASGWDLPSNSKEAGLVTTGFSGTNDSRATLPFSIKQEDLPELLHTNAMVLNLLLREDNRTYMQSVDAGGRKLDVGGLLAMMNRQTPRINVLIDVGAQVLEATNLQLVKQWLTIDTAAHAAVFYDDQDEAMVLDRSDTVTPLRISPFFSKLDACLIYLDEAHTRGIDLPIPIGGRALVTLGPRLVKDRLMQGKFCHDFYTKSILITNNIFKPVCGCVV